MKAKTERYKLLRIGNWTVALCLDARLLDDGTWLLWEKTLQA